MAINYDVIIVMSIDFAGGSAHGTGSPQSNPSTTHWGGAGYEVQVVQVICQLPCSRATVCKRALAVARQNVLDAAIKYNWQNQGLRVKTIDCTIVGTYEI